MKARDMKTHLESQLGGDALAGRVKAEPKAETRAQAWTRFYREIEQLKEGDPVPKKLESEIFAVFPAEQPTAVESSD